jgi:hypothetical protein
MTKTRWMAIGLVFAWLFLANATCESSRQGEELKASYRVARFRLVECQDMGAEMLEPGRVEQGFHRVDEIEDALDRRQWSRAQEAIVQLEGIVDLLSHRMKVWDKDKDGLSNYAEFVLYGTSWNSVDSDGDGYLDGSEIFRYQTDPLDHCAVPVNVPSETRVKRRCPAVEAVRP